MSRPDETPPAARARPDATGRDRSILALIWYRIVQVVVVVLLSAFYGLRVTGRKNVPEDGPALLISNHLSYLDVFLLGILLPRPLNYVARSTLFVPVLGGFIRSVGGFPIQREGLGASGMKETLRRLRNGGIVALFPEGTRSVDGELGEIKAGIALLASRAKVAVVPAAVAGTFESWPRGRRWPRPHPLRIHFGPAMSTDQIAGPGPDAVVALIREGLLGCQRVARRGLAGDLGLDPPGAAGRGGIRPGAVDESVGRGDT
jgi:1-acyl-sn-glycerol-3-phosphate acyltransferase